MNTPIGKRLSMSEAITQVYKFEDLELTVGRGHPLPLGASRSGEGVNFVVISRHAESITLALLNELQGKIQTEITLDPNWNRTGNHWHVRVVGLPSNFCYGYRVEGPQGPLHRYDPNVLLIDPSSLALSCGQHWGQPSPCRRLSILIPSLGDRQIDIPPRTALEDSILYELHVRGYTVDPSSHVKNPGTFLGLTEKLDHLQDLGITAVELLPIDEFDENDCPFVNPITGQRLKNFWGYNTLSYAAPKAAYACNPHGIAPANELREMVKHFHLKKIEVILDVVFNHTAEGGDNGKSYHFRGLDNSLYYMLDDSGAYLNFSGCGNTVNTNHPVVRMQVLACLRNMVAEFGIDGYRFDLASVFGRDRRGSVLVEPPVVEMISEDALLADTKLIAEPWDAGGLYQVGSFPGGARWQEWNGRYRDDVRRFWRGDPGMVSTLATRICGSDDIYRNRSPLCSINFITCHDGFTLYDLVSYNHKHNHANGEGNRDGNDHNLSWNCGAEGPTDEASVIRLRLRQARNLMATLLISQGIPMILGGDEFLRTQEGNNNAWCQDNEVSWVNWDPQPDRADFHRFTKMMIQLRKNHAVLRRNRFFSGAGSTPDIIWHGQRPCEPDFRPNSRAIAFALDGRRSTRPDILDRDLYIAMNASSDPLNFQIPASPTGRLWRRAVDTALPAPNDILEPDQGPVVPVGERIALEHHSLVILVSEEK